MADYIAKEQVKEEIISWARCITNPERLVTEDALYVIDTLPAADVREAVHGEWKERRKHKWKRYSDGTIDYFAGVDYGYHNGPLCLKCGFSFCEHCNPEGYDSECPVPDYICTVCGSEASERGKYCPNCGADMRGENDG